MSARQDDNRCVAEMWNTITLLEQRLADIGMTRETFVNPKSSLEALLAEGVYHMLERVLEECTILSIDTMFEYRDIPWKKVIGLRNRMVHDYPGTNSGILWDVIQNDLPALRHMCERFCAKQNLAPQQLADMYPDDLSR